MVIDIPKVSTSPPPHREILLILLGNISLLIASRNTAKSCESIYIHRSLIHKCRNWKRGRPQFFIWEYINGIFGTVYSVKYTEDFYTNKKENNFSSYIRKSRRERLQSHIWLTASSYMTKYLRISSYTVLGSLSSYTTLQPLPSEFPYIKG